MKRTIIFLTDVEKGSPKETPPSFWRKVDYKGDTNEKNHSSDGEEQVSEYEKLFTAVINDTNE